MKSISASQKLVIDAVDKKDYVDEKKPKYIELFVEIINGAETCNNISILRSYADKADALKIRLLNEMDSLDAEIARKKAEDEAKKQSGNGNEKTNGTDGTGTTDTNTSQAVVITVPVKETKNISIKDINLTPSWRIESKEDIEKYIDQLRKALEDELGSADIVNVIF